MEITDTMNNIGAQFVVDYGLSDQAYGMPPEGFQQFNKRLATNDARWLDGFIENGNIQFVGNSVDTSTGRAAFYHGVIEDINGARNVTGNVIGYANGSYGYPAIAWHGMNPGDDDALIAINYCGTVASQHPGCGAIYYDGQGDYSGIVKAKTGVNYISVLSGTDRWGDYTGIQTRYNQQGVVWIAGTYGKSNRDPRDLGLRIPPPQHRGHS